MKKSQPLADESEFIKKRQPVVAEFDQNIKLQALPTKFILNTSFTHTQDQRSTCKAIHQAVPVGTMVKRSLRLEEKRLKAEVQKVLEG
ncbi:MAG: hypothetical protein KAV99_05195 [Candidatus Latescibacteria bacterium]|nr:hypothetical protein [Candidatus Latescibacterota bacterium]